MFTWLPQRSSVGLQILLQLGADHGVPAARLLRGVDLAGADLSDPEAEVPASAELAVIRALLAALPERPGLGLEAGGRYHLTAYGMLGFALISSPTLRSAVEVGLRYMDLSFSFNRMRASTDGGGLCLILDDRAVPADVRDFVVDRDLAAIHNIYRELLSRQVPLREVWLRRPAPADRAPYRELFGIEPLFAAPDNHIGIDATWLDRPLPQANALTAAACERQCRELLERRETRVGVAEQVRQRLLAHPTAPPDMAEVATALHMTPRTLRRRLAAEQTSWRALADEVRATLAQALLSGAHLRVAEVADRLGYAETASFIHAFRRWTGEAPGVWRRRHETVKPD